LVEGENPKRRWDGEKKGDGEEEVGLGLRFRPYRFSSSSIRFSTGLAAAGVLLLLLKLFVEQVPVQV
jgi:hypothetical protein